MHFLLFSFLFLFEYMPAFYKNNDRDGVCIMGVQKATNVDCVFKKQRSEVAFFA
jgi:hypothetical protein